MSTREANRALLGALPADRTLVMGILNVTPDSFSDGGAHDAVGQRCRQTTTDLQRTVRHG